MAKRSRVRELCCLHKYVACALEDTNWTLIDSGLREVRKGIELKAKFINTRNMINQLAAEQGFIKEGQDLSECKEYNWDWRNNDDQE